MKLDGANTADVITWLFDPDSFAPLAKLQGASRQSIVCDHLGTPLQMHEEGGELSWAAELDSYGAVRKQLGEAGACPFRYQGQYADEETGLYYNRFRYYDPQVGQYVSQDPIGVLGNNPNAYGYVTDSTLFIDLYGLYNGEGVRDLGAYHSFHNHRLDPSEYLSSDKYHFAKANESVFNRMQSDPGFRRTMEVKYPGVTRHVSPTRNGTFRGTSPKGLTWHHATSNQVGGQPGWLQLADQADHGTYHKVYHPDDVGGRNEWGGGTSCRK